MSYGYEFAPRPSTPSLGERDVAKATRAPIRPAPGSCEPEAQNTQFAL